MEERKENIVYIDAFGCIVEEKDARYKVWLQGSYEWSYAANGWWYEVEKTEPAYGLLGRIFSKEKLI